MVVHLLVIYSEKDISCINDAKITLTFSSSSFLFHRHHPHGHLLTFTCFSWQLICKNRPLFRPCQQFQFDSFYQTDLLLIQLKYRSRCVFWKPIKSIHLILDMANVKISYVISYFVWLYFLITLMLNNGESKVLIECSIKIEECFMSHHFQPPSNGPHFL